MVCVLLRRIGSLVVVLLVLSAVVFVLQQVSPGDPVRAALGANASPVRGRRRTAAARARRPAARAVPAVHRGRPARRLRHLVPDAPPGRHRPGVRGARHRASSCWRRSSIALVLAGLFAASGALRWPFCGVYRGVAARAGDRAAVPARPRRHHPVLRAARVAAGLRARGDRRTSGSTACRQPSDRCRQHLVLPAIAPALGDRADPALRPRRPPWSPTTSAPPGRRGCGEATVLARHVVRNAVGPALSMAGLQLGFMFAGVVVVEQVFSWPGIGNYLANSIPTSDFPAIAARDPRARRRLHRRERRRDVLQAAADPRLA